MQVTKHKPTSWGYFLGALIWLQSKFKLQHVANALQRTIKLEFLEEKFDIPMFNDPWEIEKFANENFQYRLDQLNLGKKKVSIDYVTNPLVVQGRMLKGGLVGDCDDYHYWFLACLNVLRMNWLRTAVKPEEAGTLSVRWEGGGHTVTWFKRCGVVYLVDYRIKIVPKDFEGKPVDPNDWILSKILSSHAEGAKLIYYVWQDANFSVLAVNKGYL